MDCEYWLLRLWFARWPHDDLHSAVLAQTKVSHYCRQDAARHLSLSPLTAPPFASYHQQQQPYIGSTSSNWQTDGRTGEVLTAHWPVTISAMPSPARHQWRSITCADVQHQLLRQIYCFSPSLHSAGRPTSILRACFPAAEAAYREQRRSVTQGRDRASELSQTSPLDRPAATRTIHRRFPETTTAPRNDRQWNYASYVQYQRHFNVDRPGVLARNPVMDVPLGQSPRWSTPTVTITET